MIFYLYSLTFFLILNHIYLVLISLRIVILDDYLENLGSIYNIDLLYLQIMNCAISPL